MTHHRDASLDYAEVTPGELLYRLWRRKLWALAIVGVCAAASWVYLQNAARQYAIEANLLLQPGAHGLRAANHQDGRPDAELIATHSEILASQRLSRLAVEAYLETADLPPERSADPLLKPLMIAELTDQLTVKRVVGTRILNVSLRWPDALEGQRLVEHLFACYESLLFDLNQGGQVEALTTLTETERELRAELDRLETDYRTLRQESDLVGDPQTGPPVQQTLLDELATSYAQIRSRRIVLENRLTALQQEPAEVHVARRPPSAVEEAAVEEAAAAEIAGQGATALVSARREIDDVDDDASESLGALQMLSEIDLRGLQDPAAIQQELFQAEVRRQQLVRKYRGKHPDLQAIENQIADWKQRLKSLVDQAPMTLERELRAASLQEDHLKTLYEQELAQAKQLDADRLEQQQMLSRIEEVQTLHNAILSQLTQLRLNNQVTTEGGADLRVTVLDAAEPALKPAWPNDKLVLGGGLMIGMLGSSMLTLIPLRRREDVAPASEERSPASCSE
ncbi:GumC family protein [Roseimaritima sediminicola]|uniref:GumC family protein n=1 Tax=Roseimaritima sediminicola TaxID=2662066 RepID=UPI001386F966|nr:hypothetical protein [Roseimaritima sediminicola]